MGLEKDLNADRRRGKTQVTRRLVRSILYQCGWQKRSPERLTALENRLADAGLYADPDITDMDLGLGTWIRFTPEPPPPVGRVFKPERALGYHLSKYPAELERELPHLGTLRHISGGCKPEKTYGFEGIDLKPDLVFSSSSGRWLVCELERGDPKNESVDQLEMYARAVGARGKTITAALITGSPRSAGVKKQATRRIQTLRTQGFDAWWIVYDVAVRLESM